MQRYCDGHLGGRNIGVQKACKQSNVGENLNRHGSIHEKQEIRSKTWYICCNIDLGKLVVLTWINEQKSNRSSDGSGSTTVTAGSYLGVRLRWTFKGKNGL